MKDLEGKTNFQKWKVKLIFEASETVWLLDLTDPDPRYFTTDRHHCWGIMFTGICSLHTATLIRNGKTRLSFHKRNYNKVMSISIQFRVRAEKLEKLC